jgi:release factor glutamine methyltransferase
MSLSIAEALLEASQILRKAGVSESRREAGSLLGHVIQKDRTFLIAHAEDELNSAEFQSFRDVVERRAQGEPLQYITGEQDFYGRTFRVSADVLIPRPETELLIDAALSVMEATGSFICDVGTGSGCIAVTLLCESPDAHGIAVDLSTEALDIAKLNATDLGVASRLEFVISDCFNSLPEGLPKFDLIVSNPPYVAADVVAGLQREVKDHEPMIALTPGKDGLSIIRRLISESASWLRKDGHVILEIGFDQGEAVQRLVEPSTWNLVDIRPDLQGIPRIVILRKD